ncbi:MAG: hypothetical protein Ct9H300mP1_20000 [Planctomycetaceae bacterium]|nr:MAG: hypothetical protein Ct9H300mP1_20000 [Planctomycetaceae bacterium]
MDLDSLTHISGSWLRGTGPDADIVVPAASGWHETWHVSFISRADDDLRDEIATLLKNQVMDPPTSPRFNYLDVADLEQIDRPSWWKGN